MMYVYPLRSFHPGSSRIMRPLIFCKGLRLGGKSVALAGKIQGNVNDHVFDPTPEFRSI